MGKGGGRGSGKGGCECCEAIHALACCLCLVLFGGPILIAVGATLIAAANRNDRERSIDSVQLAVEAWNDANSANGWLQLQKQVIYANLTPGQQGCEPLFLQLSANLSNSDRYWDDEGRFGGIKQVRLSAAVRYQYFINCAVTVNLTQQLANGTGNGSLAVLPFMAKNTLDYSILLDKAGGPKSCTTRNDGCATSNAINCRYNCENYFYGQWTCNSRGYICTVAGTYYNSFAIKVSYRNNDSRPPGYYVDSSYPGSGGGGNVLPAGFQREYNDILLPNTVPTGPLFQVPNVLVGRQGSPILFFITVRSSADPWLTYMVATEGTGYFGVAKSTLMVTGVTLVVVGCLGTLFWVVAAFYAWWMLCSRRKPTSRPSGMSGYAWDLANRYGGPYAPALGVPVHSTGQDGMPMAQPMYVYPNQQVPGHPVAGYPPYVYPPPYGVPQPGPYPPYTYPHSYPPPDGLVEMNQFNAHPQPYAYPPPTTAAVTGSPEAHAGQPAPYGYPYAYPYPPYGAGPPALVAATPSPGSQSAGATAASPPAPAANPAR
ncbi:hypothetical protein Vretimale_11740 [Volvox reticuliferus]|uniref:Uncharacterized protein n=2 Tax=Volvox reticuliferus TaxID=1737510 RepID=A0A8J4FZD8_9CHLO|nr:hypothetical protein Vretifemale_20258 [Volvox reticuliferus]GIM07655.1 hypothetical protein Vretimale_11740 [Volvox reticuliferus]